MRPGGERPVQGPRVQGVLGSEVGVAGVESAKEAVPVHESGKETSGTGRREDRLCQPLQRTLFLL